MAMEGKLYVDAGHLNFVLAYINSHNKMLLPLLIKFLLKFIIPTIIQLMVPTRMLIIEATHNWACTEYTHFLFILSIKTALAYKKILH